MTLPAQPAIHTTILSKCDELYFVEERFGANRRVLTIESKELNALLFYKQMLSHEYYQYASWADSWVKCVTLKLVPPQNKRIILREEDNTRYIPRRSKNDPRRPRK